MSTPGTRNAALFLAVVVGVVGVLAADEGAPAPKAKTGWDALVEGNRRYVEEKTTHPDQTPARRGEVAAVQHPLAVVLSCSDSRVPPELVFDQGLGDLFVIRVAGNVVDDVTLGSIEYAVEHLHVPLVVVLGHERCGAVSAAVAGGEAAGHIRALVERILPAVERVKDQPGDKVENAVRENVREVVNTLRASEPILSKGVLEGKLTLVGARYDLDTGVVEEVK